MAEVILTVDVRIQEDGSHTQDDRTDVMEAVKAGDFEIINTRTEKVVCNRCGATYTDAESVELAKKWRKEFNGGYAPCPNIACKGQLEVK